MLVFSSRSYTQHPNRCSEILLYAFPFPFPKTKNSKEIPYICLLDSKDQKPQPICWSPLLDETLGSKKAREGAIYSLLLFPLSRVQGGTIVTWSRPLIALAKIRRRSPVHLENFSTLTLCTESSARKPSSTSKTSVPGFRGRLSKFYIITCRQRARKALKAAVMLLECGSVATRLSICGTLRLLLSFFLCVLYLL